MKILYLTNYQGSKFLDKYCQGKKYALSGIFKSQGIARALLSAGHQVTIYSPGVTSCNQSIPAFTEYEDFPEGKLEIKYCNILSKRKCAPINDWRISRMVRRDIKHFDAIIYYNISISAWLSLGAAKHAKKILEYEDNIFNKSLVGGKNNFVWFKSQMFKYIIQRTDGIMAVCNGLMLPQICHKVLTPGIVSDTVVDNVSFRINTLHKEKPVKIILTGGTHYSKGSDLLINAMKYVKTPCEVEFYGNGSFYQAALDEIKNVPNIHKITNKGYMEHGKLIKLLDETADILINTTRSMGVGAQAAGFPFKMMEYASTGRPIISSEIGKLDDDFNRYITYYEGENPKSIACAIEEVIANYDIKVKLALTLQQYVLDEYSIKGIGKKLDNFLTNMG